MSTCEDVMMLLELPIIVIVNTFSIVVDTRACGVDNMGKGFVGEVLMISGHITPAVLSRSQL